MYPLKVYYRVRVLFDAVPPRGFVWQHHDTGKAFLLDPQNRFQLDLKVQAKLLTPPYTPLSTTATGANLGSKQQRDGQFTRGLIYADFFLTEFNAPVDNHSPRLQFLTKVAEAELGPVDAEDMLTSDRDRLVESAKDMVNHRNLKMNVREEGGDFLSQLKFALIQQFVQSSPTACDEGLRGLNTFLDGLQEAQYVEVLREALEELQNLCSEYYPSKSSECHVQ